MAIIQDREEQPAVVCECDAAVQLNQPCGLPCLDCLSDSQLLVYLFIGWYYVTYPAGTLTKEEAINYLTGSLDWANISDKQRLEAEVNAMANAMPDSLTSAGTLQLAKCLECVAPEQIRGAISKLKCTYWNSLPA